MATNNSEFDLYVRYTSDGGTGNVKSISIIENDMISSAVYGEDQPGVWQALSGTFPNDRDYIVTSNNLPTGSDTYWGFENMYILDDGKGTQELPLTKVPLGYYADGETVRFTRTDLKPVMPETEQRLSFDGEGSVWFGSAIPDPFVEGIMVSSDPVDNRAEQVYEAATQSWKTTSFTFPTQSTKSLIATENNLPTSTPGNWGFDYAFITVTVLKVPVPAN